ncbi:hypothetical protein DXG03_004655 [Asterophora parasitica]|uniref:Uncharacterized protein n=1 Tax=Asterophora parasitica TaxID=117018 RepID=A0A9P7G0W1_9AGAR|nr:hypothetical protein DXG03_004655 [Asterophora parasitica]
MRGLAVDEFNVHSDANLGSMEVALAISQILFGVVVVQAYNYYQNYDDRFWLKSLVSTFLRDVGRKLTKGWEIGDSRDVRFAMDIPYSPGINCPHDAAQAIGITLANRTDVGPNSYPLTTGVILETFITNLVQCFFAYRIYRLSGKLYITLICWTLSALRFGGGLAIAAQSYLNVPKQTNEFVLTNRFAWLITLGLSVGAFIDVLIAFSLCYYIKHLTPRATSKRSSLAH